MPTILILSDQTQSPKKLSVPVSEFTITQASTRPRIPVDGDRIWSDFNRAISSLPEFELTEVPHRPSQGMSLIINIISKTLSPFNEALLIASFATATIIPFYGDTAGYSVGYDVYVDQDFKKRYSYEVTHTVLSSLLLDSSFDRGYQTTGTHSSLWSRRTPALDWTTPIAGLIA